MSDSMVFKKDGIFLAIQFLRKPMICFVNAFLAQGSFVLITFIITKTLFFFSPGFDTIISTTGDTVVTVALVMTKQRRRSKLLFQSEASDCFFFAYRVDLPIIRNTQIVPRYEERKKRISLSYPILSQFSFPFSPPDGVKISRAAANHDY